jgi:L-asparagine oxygenase
MTVFLESHVAEVVIPAGDRDDLTAVVNSLLARFGRADEPAFLHEAGQLGHLLPEGLRAALRAIRYTENAAALVVRGGPELGDPGPTPRHWQDRDPVATARHDLWQVLVMAQLGDPVAWSVWQDGHLINDVLPVPGEEHEQTGLGSTAELEFHVEEALYDNRCDYLGLMCLRNLDGSPTSVASIDAVDLAAMDVDVLFEPRFRIGDDKIVPALFGSPESPYLRLDPPYMTALPGEDRAAAAFAQLCGELDRAMVDVVLAAGDLLLVDNYRAVHGRKPFRARYDGTDRWLHRCTTTRDLRVTRGQRRGATDRVITPVP